MTNKEDSPVEPSCRIFYKYYQTQAHTSNETAKNITLTIKLNYLPSQQDSSSTWYYSEIKQEYTITLTNEKLIRLVSREAE